MKFQLLKSKICSFVTCGCDPSISAYDLLIFTLGSFVIVSTLIAYYNKIPKSNSPEKKLGTPIYQTKDILLQSNSSDASFIIAEKTTSTWVKVITVIMIVVVSCTPLYKLLGTGYFL